METPEDLQTLIQEASKMKNAELEEKRKEWRQAPDFLKLTLTNKSEILAVREKKTFAERLVFISQHKDRGNTLCQDGQYEAAVAEYTESLGVLLWFYLPNGKHSEEIPLFSGYKEFESAEDVALAQESLQVILLNIAHCLNKLCSWEASIYACTYTLRLDRYNIKALYRRAVAYYGQGTSYTLDQAVEDLLQANSIDPEDKQVAKLLSKYFKEKVQQDRKDSKIWKRSFARMKEQPISEPLERDGDASTEIKSIEMSWVGSLLNWASRNPLVFAVYVLIFGHAVYRIYKILNTEYPASTMQ